MSDERCETCRFWVRLYPGKIPGSCHRCPPVVTQEHMEDGTSGAATEWPFAESREWCGEYQPVLIPFAE